MAFTYEPPEIRELRRKLAYHNACEAQYLDAAAKLTAYPKMHQRALDNAQWHREHAFHVENQLAREHA